MRDKYIITTPFIDRPATHRMWLRHFEALDIPKKDCLVLWYDISGSKLVAKQLLEWADKHKDEYLGFKIITEPQEFTADYGGGFDKRYMVAKTMKQLMEFKKEMISEHEIDADRILIEDDVMFPSDTFQKLRKLAYFDDDIWMTTGVNYPKKNEADYLIMWDEVIQKKFQYAHDQTERRTVIDPVRKYEEKKKGYHQLIATSTGFVYIKKEAEEGYAPDVLKVVQDEKGRTMVNGQDMNFGWWITRINAKIIMLDWSIKMPHIGDQYPQGVYKSEMCTYDPIFDDSDILIKIIGTVSNNTALDEMRFLHRLASTVKNQTIIELGTHCGKSALVMADAIKNGHGIVLAMDKFGKSNGWDADAGKKYTDTLEVAKEGAKKLELSKHIIFLKGDFKKTQSIVHAQAGMVFIDGDHTKAGIEYNTEFALRVLEKGGIIAYHDYNNKSWPETKKAIDAMKIKYGLKEIELVGSLKAFLVPTGEYITSGEVRE